MTRDKKSDPVFDALARSLEQLSDEEIEAEFAEDGEDLAVVAAGTRATLLGAIAEHQRERRALLAKERAEQLESLSRSDTRLPALPAARRTFLGRQLRRLAEEGSSATTQFRNLDEMSDADVESALKQLAFLELLEEPQEDG